MTDGPPKTFAINRDNYHAEHVGHTGDGRQFFLTTPFEPATREQAGSEYLALFLFNGEGTLLEAKIDDFGPRATMVRGARAALRKQRLRELGDVTFDRIEIAPFSVERFNTTFGLIARPPDQFCQTWWVELHPGNCMAFHEPWDSGEYDT